MPEPQEIEFIIKPDGSVEEVVRGVSGPDCETLTSGIEAALGDVEHREHTSDYYRQASQSGDHVSTSV